MSGFSRLLRRADTRGASELRGRRLPAQALVELALILVTLCSFVAAGFDYGRVTNLYLVTVNAAREAARTAAVAGSTSASITTAAQSAAADAIPPADLVVTCQMASFAPSSATFTPSGPCGGAQVQDTAFIVTVRTTVTPLMPVTGLLFGSGSIGPLQVSYAVPGVVLTGP